MHKDPHIAALAALVTKYGASEVIRTLSQLVPEPYADALCTEADEIDRADGVEYVWSGEEYVRTLVTED